MIIPNISWSKNEGFSFEISIIVGISDIACTQAGIGYNFKGKDFNFYVGATAPFNLSVKKSLCEEKEK